jgi:hypothetical protein
MKYSSEKCELAKKKLRVLKKEFPINLNAVLIFPDRRNACYALVEGCMKKEDLNKFFPQNKKYHINLMLENGVITEIVEGVLELNEPYKSLLLRQLELEKAPDKTIEEILATDKQFLKEH